MSWLSDNFISRFFIVVISFLAAQTGNYLVAVVLFTFLIKLVLLPLDIKQRSSTRKMTAIQGKVKEIQERYKHDQQLQALKMRELYKKENVSLSAGCLPLLLQMPIMFAMFGAVRMASNIEICKFVAELIQDPSTPLPGMLWVHNIWQPDTGTANVMPSLIEFSSIFKQASNKLDANLITQISTLLDNSTVQQLAMTAGALPQGTFFAGAAAEALQMVPADVVTAASSMNYTSLVGPILAQYEGVANGWFIFPILSGLALFGSTWITTRQQKKANTGNNSTSMQMMTYIMPVMAVWMASTAAVPFSIYWISSSAFSIIQYLILDLIDKRKNKDNKEVATQ